MQGRVRMEPIYQIRELCLRLSRRWLPRAPRERDCDQLKAIEMAMVQFT
jgi:hypothetical protein